MMVSIYNSDSICCSYFNKAARELMSTEEKDSSHSSNLRSSRIQNTAPMITARTIVATRTNMLCRTDDKPDRCKDLSFAFVSVSATIV